MGIYRSSKGEEKETADMPLTYLKNALNKATALGDIDNIDVLQAELDLRESNNDEIDEPTDEDDDSADYPY